MIKKVSLSASGSAFIGMFVGRDAISYVRHSFGYLKQSAQEAVPSSSKSNVPGG